MPEDIYSANITVELDRGGVITEGNETNNIQSISIEINEKADSDSTSSSFDISSSTVWLITILVLILIIGLFKFAAPPKIRKIN